MLTKLIKFVHPVKFASQLFNRVKKYQTDIILVTGVILISLLSFALGYITANYQEKIPLKFEYEETKSSNNWSGNMWSLFSLETF